MNSANLNTTQEIKLIEDSRRLCERLLKREHGDNRYRTERELGRGAMGVIHVAYDQDLQRISAMKVIQKQLIDLEKRFHAFVSEARLTAQLEHPNIVPIHELGIIKESGTPYYTMKLVEGEPLSDIIDKVARGEAAYVAKYNRHALLNIFWSLCHAIAYAHSRGVIHRDIKPENVMVGQFGEVLVMDWGLAKFVDTAETDSGPVDKARLRESIGAEDVMMTQDGMIKGSPAYMSPEQAFGEIESVGKHTDIFLLGSTLYHIFTHHPPYEGTDIMAIVGLAETCDFVSPNERNPNSKIPLALERIILRAMAPLKENRYQSVEDMIEDINAFNTGRRVSGRKVFAAGEDLVVAGEKTSEFYVVVSGQVEIHRQFNDKRMRVAVVGPGDILGEMAGITQTLSSANATALETTETLVITHELMIEELQKLPPWLEQIVVSLTSRVKRSLTKDDPVLQPQDAYSVILALYSVFCVARELKKAHEERIFSMKAVVEEVALMVGAHLFAIERVISALIDARFLAMDHQDQLEVTDPDEFRLFTDFCRSELTISGGVRQVQLGAMRLTPEQEKQFKRGLRNCTQAIVKQ